MLRLFAFLMLFSLSCKVTSPGRNHLLNFDCFTIETPRTWEKIKVQGVDSYVGRIALDHGEHVDFDLGRYSDPLKEDESAGPVKNNIAWDMIDGRKAKIVSPRQHGNGITGVYIDSLWGPGQDKEALSFCGINLNLSNEKEFLTAIRTIKFHAKK